MDFLWEQVPHPRLSANGVPTRTSWSTSGSARRRMPYVPARAERRDAAARSGAGTGHDPV